MDSKRGRLVGVDFGTKRTGIALADPLRMFAQAHGTYSPDEALAQLRRIHEAEGIETLVIGWPLLPDGTEGAGTARVEAYVRRLEGALPNVRIELWDERESSIEARELLFRAGVRKQGRREKGRLDAAAAAVILQSFLDSSTGT